MKLPDRHTSTTTSPHLRIMNAMKPRCFGMGLLGAWALAGGTGCDDASNAPGQRAYRVEFHLVAPGLPQGQQPFVAGSDEKLGGWAPDGVPLRLIGGDTWSGSVEVEAPSFEFKWTLGRWEREALDAQGYGRANAVATLRGDTVIRDTVRGWSEGGAPRRLEGQVTGQLEDWGVVTPTGLLPRAVMAWIPPGTDPIETIVFFHDGQNVFDPARANFGVDWGVDETLDSLMATRQIGRTLAIGIDCTPERYEEYGRTEKGAAYVDWMLTELLAMARQRHVSRGEPRVVVAGASMGGLISAFALERHPETVDGIVAMSPAFHYREFDYVEALRGAGAMLPTDVPIWIDNGTVGLESQLQLGVARMDSALTSAGACHQTTVFAEAQHVERDWGKRFPEALLWVRSQNCAARE